MIRLALAFVVYPTPDPFTPEEVPAHLDLDHLHSHLGTPTLLWSHFPRQP